MNVAGWELNWHEIVQIFSLTTYEEWIGTVLLSSEAASGKHLWAFYPSPCTAAGPGPAFKGQRRERREERVALCKSFIRLTTQNGAVAAVCRAALFVACRGGRCLCVASLPSLVPFAAVPCGPCLRTAFPLPSCPTSRFPLPKAQLSPTAPPPSRSLLSAARWRDAGQKASRKTVDKRLGVKATQEAGQGQGCWGTGACSSSASAGAVRVTHACRAGAGWAVRPDTAPARVRKGSGPSVWSWQPVATSEMSKLVCETLSVPAASRLGGTARWLSLARVGTRAHLLGHWDDAFCSLYETYSADNSKQDKLWYRAKNLSIL